MDLADSVNAPREIVIGGLPYKISGLTRAEWGGLQAWLKDKAKDPITRAYEELASVRKRGVEIDDRDRDAVLIKARDENASWPPVVASLRWFEVLNAVEGGPMQFFSLVMRKHQPSLSDEQLAELIEKIDADTSEVLTWRAIGVDPPPKASGPEAAANRKGRRASTAKKRRNSITT